MMATKILKNVLRLKSLNNSNACSLLCRYKNTDKTLTVYDPFVAKPKKTKEVYLEVVKMFEERDTRRRGHVEFIYAAMARMQEFNVHKDLEVYKALIEVLPKGKFIPTNIFQAEFMHYPKQQQCAVDLLEKMENNGVMPDTEMEQMLLNIFGRRGIPLRKYWRMMYWMPKFKNLSPWYLPDKLPNDILELAKLAIQRISSADPDTKVEVWQTEEIEASLDKTWVISSQSASQKVLLSEQPDEEPLVVRGPYDVYIKDQVVSYFVLLGKTRTESKVDVDLDDVSSIQKPSGIPGYISQTTLPSKKCSVHEQDDGTILSICATGTSSRDSLLSWIRLLEKYGNPSLSSTPVIFTLSAPSADVSLYETQPAVQNDSENKSDNAIN